MLISVETKYILLMDYIHLLFSASVIFSFIGWIGFVSSLLLQEYSGLVTKKSKIDMATLLWWQKSSFIKICFVSIAFLTVLLLFGKYNLFYIYFNDFYLLRHIIINGLSVHKKCLLFKDPIYYQDSK